MDAFRYDVLKKGGDSKYGFYSKKVQRYDDEGQPIEPPQANLYGYSKVVNYK
jgi:hypothetical protein